MRRFVSAAALRIKFALAKRQALRSAEAKREEELVEALRTAFAKAEEAAAKAPPATVWAVNALAETLVRFLYPDPVLDALSPNDGGRRAVVDVAVGEGGKLDFDVMAVLSASSGDPPGTPGVLKLRFGVEPGGLPEDQALARGNANAVRRTVQEAMEKDGKQ